MSALTTEGSLTVEQVPLDRLRPDPANPRRMSGERLDSTETPVGRTPRGSQIAYVRAFPSCVHGRVSLFFL